MHVMMEHWANAPNHSSRGLSDSIISTRSLSGVTPNLMEAAQSFDRSSKRLMTGCANLQQLAEDHVSHCQALQTAMNSHLAAIDSQDATHELKERLTQKDKEIKTLKSQNERLSNLKDRFMIMSLGLGSLIGLSICYNVYSWWSEKKS